MKLKTLLVVAFAAFVHLQSTQAQVTPPKVVTQYWYPIRITCFGEPTFTQCFAGEDYEDAQANAAEAYPTCMIEEEIEPPPAYDTAEACNASIPDSFGAISICPPSRRVRPASFRAYVCFCFSNGTYQCFNGFGCDPCSAVRSAQRSAQNYARRTNSCVCSWCVKDSGPTCSPTTVHGRCVPQQLNCCPSHLSRRQLKKLRKRCR